MLVFSANLTDVAFEDKHKYCLYNLNAALSAFKYDYNCEDNKYLHQIGRIIKKYNTCFLQKAACGLENAEMKNYDINRTVLNSLRLR